MNHERGRSWPLFLFAILALLAAGGALLTIARRWLDVVEINGRSMAPTLLPGDRLLVESLTYRRRPPRVGEVVLAPDPRLPERELIKRVSDLDLAAATVRVAGDARLSSTDSRAFGPLPLGTVRWRVVARYWPPRLRSTTADPPDFPQMRSS